MSGIKYRTLSDTEYNRLQREASQGRVAASRAEAAERANRQLQRDLDAQSAYNASLASRIGELDRKMRNANATASDLKKKLTESIKTTNEALKKQAAAFEVDLKQTRNDFSKAIERNNRRIEQVINANNAAVDKKIVDLKKDIDGQLEELRDFTQASLDDLNKKVGDPAAVLGMAVDYLDIANELVSAAGEYRHELLLPGRLAAVKSAIDKAAGSIKLAENPAATAVAFVDGRAAYEDAHKFYAELLAAEVEWANKLSAAEQALTAAEAEICAREKVELEVALEDGETGNEEFDVDFWSGGALSILTKDIENIRGKHLVKGEVEKLSMQDLDSIAARAQLIADSAEEAFVGAVFAIDCSEDRVNILADVAEELAGKSGLTKVKKDGYEGDDMRAANLVRLKSETTDFEVEIVLVPEMVNGKLGFRAETEIKNQGNSKAVASAFEAALTAVMKEHDLCAGDVKVPVSIERKETRANWETRIPTVPKVETVAASTPLNLGENTAATAKN